MPVDDGEHGGGEAELGSDVEIRTAADQELDGLEMAAERSEHERGLAMTIECVEVCAGGDLLGE
jgi:hypothetical protein